MIEDKYISIFAMHEAIALYNTNFGRKERHLARIYQFMDKIRMPDYVFEDDDSGYIQVLTASGYKVYAWDSFLSILDVIDEEDYEIKYEVIPKPISKKQWAKKNGKKVPSEKKIANRNFRYIQHGYVSSLYSGEKVRFAEERFELSSPLEILEKYTQDYTKIREVTIVRLAKESRTPDKPYVLVLRESTSYKSTEDSLCARITKEERLSLLEVLLQDKSVSYKSEQAIVVVDTGDKHKKFIVGCTDWKRAVAKMFSA